MDLIGDSLNILAGVTDAHLSNDIFVGYASIIIRNTFRTAGVSVFIPREGSRLVVAGKATGRVGGFVNVVVN